MISAKRLVELATKWQKAAAMRRGRISTVRSRSNGQTGARVARVHKGQAVVYTLDGVRFMVPVAYLNSAVFKELFKLSEDEFGLPADGPITLPCSGLFMDCLISAIRRRMPESFERDLLVSIASGRCSTTIFGCDHPRQADLQQHLLLHGF